MCIAWHNVFTSCLENSHACYVKHMYSGFVFQAEVWYLFTKQYNFLAAKIKACSCLFQEWMPQNDFSALHYICHHEIDIIVWALTCIGTSTSPRTSTFIGLIPCIACMLDSLSVFLCLPWQSHRSVGVKHSSCPWCPEEHRLRIQQSVDAHLGTTSFDSENCVWIIL